MRYVRKLWPWAILLVLVTGLLGWGINPTYRPQAVNGATLLGMLLLAAPAIRINEQGRRIAKAIDLQKGIADTREALHKAELTDKDREEHQGSLEQREQWLADALKELAGEKGTWVITVHAMLYLGYVLLLASAVTRVVR